MDDSIKMVPEKPHRVVIESRERLSVTGVLDVDSFNENEIIFMTSCGAITINGFDLHIAKLNLEDATLIIEGKIQALDYADHDEMRASGGLFKKVFR